ncbi:hypothetical protein AB6D11_00255 [Vibrio splendidus]
MLKVCISLVMSMLAMNVYSKPLYIEHRKPINDLVQTPVPKEPSVYLSVNPDTIRQGESADLTWVGHKISGVSLSHGLGYQSVLSGSLSVSPSATIQYRVDVDNLYGSHFDLTTLTVLRPEPVVTVKFQPSSVFDGESILVSWDLDNTDNVELAVDGDSVGGFDPKDSFSLTPTSNHSELDLLAHGDNITVEETIPVPVVMRDRRSCKTLHEQDPSLSDGDYTLNIGHAKCLMGLDGGGWTFLHNIKAGPEVTVDTLSISDQNLDYTEVLFIDRGSYGDFHAQMKIILGIGRGLI